MANMIEQSAQDTRAHPALAERRGRPRARASRLSRLLREIGITFGLIALVATGVEVATATPAEAAAFTYSVYAPHKVSSTTAEGWAYLSHDCRGTYGCANYMKIEEREWWGWSNRGGGWVYHNGWNTARGSLTRGCAYYRTTVDSYNDLAGRHHSGTNLGPVGHTRNGTTIYRYRTTWSSGTTRLCR
ncbi:hypothetical protein J2W21_003384 [Sinomonas atrocyanea]|uniref:hypothetical protein n=1 Tax=Sinomonas atrocyanea TaxID=37927 RepID=UPI00277FFDC5|nr:hypothetical protein [Sinomonas atrocyanea]MDP9885859.1 hypothetical protein [Sinomonas atrocyanea]